MKLYTQPYMTSVHMKFRQDLATRHSVRTKFGNSFGTCSLQIIMAHRVNWKSATCFDLFEYTRMIRQDYMIRHGNWSIDFLKVHLDQLHHKDFHFYVQQLFRHSVVSNKTCTNFFLVWLLFLSFFVANSSYVYFFQFERYQSSHDSN